ncbi:DegT/DnrJ/EryC1/StrS family aminotransferase [Streptomyces sp. SID14478]|nr:DegT/DnrJ/EryC1/StrS family aminotransferase [Streptomyces sp. SID14478]NEB75980.1 DegT/DnrJ/EryC1/StrS family aminotransferase [Streptomyces sp. SID14478]
MNGASFAQNARPFLYGGEEEAVQAVLASGQYGHGEVTERFERAVADFLGVDDVVAVASGTVALHLALAVAGIGPGDEVIVPSMTFCASVQAICATGATPRFAEVNAGSLCAGPEEISDALTPATRAVVPVLYGGRAVDLTPLRDELGARSIVLVEDAAHAFGSRTHGRYVGATGQLTCFSFGPIKNLTCGQGGAIVPRSAQEAEQVRRMRLLGMTESPDERARSVSYTVSGPGLRAHLSQLNAAIGLAQLPHFPQMATARRTLWCHYAQALDGVPGIEVVDVQVGASVPSLFAVQVPYREHVFTALRDNGIGVGTHYPPNHLQPAFARWRRPLPVTERIGKRILTLPFHPKMTGHDVETVAEAVRGALR